MDGLATQCGMVRQATGGGGGDAWSPAELGSALMLWLDAADESTITLIGSGVSQWDDKSGNTNHATQSVAADQPTYTANGLNSKPVMTFDGAGDGVLLANGITVPRSIYAVSRGSGYLLSSSIVSPSRLAYASGSRLYWNTASGSPTGAVPASYDDSTYTAHGYIADDTAYEVIIDGVSELSGSLSGKWVDGNHFDQIGPKWGSPTGLPTWNGEVAEVVITNSLLPTDDRQKLEGYLAHKWGLQASLPAGHPYKSAPPTV